MSLISSVVLIVGLLYTWLTNLSQNKDKKSQFYLTQIKEYFKAATDLLISGGNNNIKWHQAIQLIITADFLSSQLTEEPHRNICVTEYLNTGYRIVDILTQIKDFRFFYGVENYSNQESELLHIDTDIELTKEYHYKRISPESLMNLCRFIEKSTKINFDLNHNRSLPINCFSSAYFKQPITDKNIEISPFTRPNVKKIDDYITNYNKIEKHSC